MDTSSPPQYYHDVNMNQPILNQPGVYQMTPDSFQRSRIPETEWKVELCDCCRSGEWCALSLLCPIIADCMVGSRLNENPCFAFCCGILPLSVRFRSIYGVNMDMCDEAFTWCFCPCCMRARLLNEMDVRGVPN